MLVIREVGRLVLQAVAMGVRGRRIGVLLLLVAAALVVISSAAATAAR